MHDGIKHRGTEDTESGPHAARAKPFDDSLFSVTSVPPCLKCWFVTQFIGRIAIDVRIQPSAHRSEHFKASALIGTAACCAGTFDTRGDSPLGFELAYISLVTRWPAEEPADNSALPWSTIEAVIAIRFQRS